MQQEVYGDRGNYVGRENVENHLESKILIDAPTQRLEASVALQFRQGATHMRAVVAAVLSQGFGIFTQFPWHSLTMLTGA